MDTFYRYGIYTIDTTLVRNISTVWTLTSTSVRANLTVNILDIDQYHSLSVTYFSI